MYYSSAQQTFIVYHVSGIVQGSVKMVNNISLLLEIVIYLLHGTHYATDVKNIHREKDMVLTLKEFTVY